MERQGKGTNGFIILAKHHTEKKIMRIKYLQQNFYWCYTTKQEKQSVFREGRKRWNGNEKMFWFKFEDRASGEGLKELDEKKWEFGSSGLRRLDPMAWKELNPEGRSWIKWLYEFSSLVSLWWSSFWGELQSEEFSPLDALVADTLLPPLGCCWR